MGIVESTTYRDLPVRGRLPGTLRSRRLTARRPGWSAAARSRGTTSAALNPVGATVLSRAVMLDPPPDSALPAQLTPGFGNGHEVFAAVVVLVVVMALLEVVLLAGPAFAVGARRQARTLALMAATGGTPKQSRRVVLAGSRARLGRRDARPCPGGIGLAGRCSRSCSVTPAPGSARSTCRGCTSSASPGSDCSSALLAAVVPAWIASRQDVVAVLAGRRGDRPPTFGRPLLGLVLLGVGIAGAVGAGARRHGGEESAIAGSAIPPCSA